MDHEEPKQLKLTNRADGEPREKKDKKEKESKGNKWIVITILLISIVISLVFYFSGRRKQSNQIPVENQQENQFGGAKVYQF